MSSPLSLDDITVRDWVGCSDDCAICVQHFTGTYYLENKSELKSQLVSSGQARDTARKLASECKRDREYLRNTLALFGDAIRAKWKKLGSLKRERAILQARPDLYQHKWLHQRLVYGAEQQNDFSDNRGLHALLMPWLNVEELRDDPMRLLSLLHHRASSKLEDWVSFDVASSSMSFDDGLVKLQYFPGCVSMNDETYGEIVPVDYEQLHSWIILGFPRAYIVLHVQSTVLKFLRGMVDQLHVPGQSREGNTDWLSLTTSGFKTSGQLVCRSTIANQAFSSPVSFSPHTCLELARTQLQAAEDHLRFLQTDPAYLQAIARERHQHQTQIGCHSQRLIWSGTAIDLVVVPSMNIRNLRGIVTQCEYLIQLMEEEKVLQRGMQPLPDRTDRALGALHKACLKMYNIEANEVPHALFNSPSFSEHYERINQSFHLRGADKGQSAQYKRFRNDPLHMALIMLSNEQNTTTYPDDRMSSTFQYVEQLFVDEKQRRRISQRLNHQLSMMALYHQIIVSISLHRPHPTDAAKGQATENPVSHDGLAPGLDGYMDCVTDGFVETDQEQLSTALQAECSKLWPKGVRDDTWLQKASEIRERTRSFWALAYKLEEDAFALKSKKKELSQEAVASNLKLLTACDSLEHRAEVEDERQLVRERVARRAKGKQKIVAPVEIQSHWGASSEEKFVLPVGRSKPKTRAEPNLVNPPTETHEADTDTADHNALTPKIPVSSGSLRIFSKMFPLSDDSTKGRVKWTQVVAAMADAGFGATQGGGSAVAFHANQPSASGTIVFHRPHPENEVDPARLQIMGKRMQKWFGWNHATFVEKQKDESD